MKLLHGDRAAREVSERIGAPVATLTVLKQTPANRRVDGQVFHVLADNTFWQWVDAAVCSGDDVLAVNPTDAPSTGRFMRLPGRATLALNFAATTPTGTNLLTVPSNTIIALNATEFGVKVTRVFTGPSNAGVGLSSTNHLGHTGVAAFAGSCVATLLNNMFSATAAGTGCDFQMAPIASGTFDSLANKRTWMKGGDTFRHDVIGAGFGTGVGQWLIPCDILKNPGV
jgi:hypothetical protein